MRTTCPVLQEPLGSLGATQLVHLFQPSGGLSEAAGAGAFSADRAGTMLITWEA
jgi:hypothetical protein